MGAANSSEFGRTSDYKTEHTEGQEAVNIRDGYYKNKKGVFYEGVSLNLSKRELSSFEKLIMEKPSRQLTLTKIITL